MTGSAEARLVLSIGNIVGESAVWDDREQCLLWVDIISRRIHRYAPASGEHESWLAPDIATSIGLRADGGAIVGLKKVVALWEPGGDFRPLTTVEPDRPDNRLNEGVVGPDGAFWLGTMQDNISESGGPKDMTGDHGHLYRLTSDGSLARLCDDAFGITNTFAWTPDGRLVTADTTKNELYSYRIEQDPVRLTDRRTILAGFARGLPDGSCLDAEGHVWNCRVAGGSAVIRLAPSGKVDRIVDLPCSWPTSCAFGGPDLSTLYVTSARFTMEDAHLAAHPEEGGLFAVDVGVAGRKAYRFG